MKKIIALLLAVCLLCGVTVSLAGCSMWGAPKIEQIYDRVVELIDGAQELNTVFYGAGMPVYATDSFYADYAHLYFGFTYEGDYEMVSFFSRYQSVDEIKKAAEKVFSTAILESMIYPSAFEGYAVDDGRGDALFAYSRFYEDTATGRLYQSTDSDFYRFSGIRVYDYSTMRVIAPSHADACYVELSVWPEDDPEAVTTETIRLVRQDDGLWYLDSFTM